MLRIALNPRNLLDPRGRCNRAGLLVVAAVLLAVEVVIALAFYTSGVSFTGPLAWAVKLVLLWTAIAATSQRLHDCGMSAWWILGAAAGVMAWCFVVTSAVMVWLGPTGFEPGAIGFIVSLLSVMLPVLGLVLWLHCAPGQVHANDYGPVPGPDGFAKPVPAMAPPNQGDLASAI
jgi:uncharacterized membrane protein YhaH (DUF805 family)